MKPHTLDSNLVTHQSQKVWFSHDCPYVRPHIHTYLPKYAHLCKSMWNFSLQELSSQGFSLRDQEWWVYSIGHPCNVQLTLLKTRHPLTSITYIVAILLACVRLGLIKVTCCCFFYELTAAVQVQDLSWIAGSSHVNLLWEGALLFGLAKSVFYSLQSSTTTQMYMTLLDSLEKLRF